MVLTVSRLSTKEEKDIRDEDDDTVHRVLQLNETTEESSSTQKREPSQTNSSHVNGNNNDTSIHPQQQQQQQVIDEQKAAKILAQAPHILQAIDDAHIIVHGDHAPRMVPQFTPSEIVVGEYLGQGGYGVVHTIANIVLSSSTSTTSTTPTPSTTNNHNHTNDDNHENTAQNVNSTATEATTTITTAMELQKTRQFMECHCQRQGKARYAIKRNRYQDLKPQHRARGMIDLAVEAKYLSTVSHPNIIKLRGIADRPLVSEHFFIIVDRLEITLDAKIVQWTNELQYIHDLSSASNQPKGLGVWWGRKKRWLENVHKTQQEALQDLMVRRLTVAFDLAKAFYYLHAHQVLYRDIKATNIGFDLRGDVKIFDFGFCKSLCPTLKADHDSYGYKLTPRVGSFPYMAPEVFKKHPYDTKCDVFSFAVLLWEMLSLQLAWTEYTPNEFIHHVFMKEERTLPIAKEWPTLTRLLISEAWHPLPTKRPDMQRIVNMIRSDLKDMTTDESVLRRTKHMGLRSQHSVEEEEEHMAMG
jgi:serine/threonine protein kinase